MQQTLFTVAVNVFCSFGCCTGPFIRWTCLRHANTSQTMQRVCFRSRTIRSSINTPPRFSRLGDPSCKMPRLIEQCSITPLSWKGKLLWRSCIKRCPPSDSALEINFPRQQCLISGSSNGTLFYCQSAHVEQLTAHHGPKHRELQ